MASSMATTVAAAVLAFLTFASSAAGIAINITEILAEFDPEFSTFNGLLSQTKLDAEINHRTTITVLVVDNAAATAITSLPADAQHKVLAVNTILGYYDPVKLDTVKKRTALFPTLYQVTAGAATGRTGLINYTQGVDDQLVFGSAEIGAPVSSQLVKVVACRPHNLSVMQVTAAIVPPSIGGASPGKGNAALTAEASTMAATEADFSPVTSDEADSAAEAEGPAVVVVAPVPAAVPPPQEKGGGLTSSAESRALVRESVGLNGLVMLISTVFRAF